jgi:hypothetical protein
VDETSADSKDTFASGARFSPPSYLSSKKKKQRGKKNRKAKGKGPTEADQTKKKRKSEGQRTWLELWPVNSGPGVGGSNPLAPTTSKILPVIGLRYLF